MRKSLTATLTLDASVKSTYVKVALKIAFDLES